MTKCWYKDPERRLNFTEIYKRLDGDYSFSVEKVPKKPRKAKEVPAYSVPPSLIPEPKKSGKSSLFNDFPLFRAFAFSVLISFLPRGGGALGTHTYGRSSPIFLGQMLTQCDNFGLNIRQKLYFWVLQKHSVQL